MPFLLDFRVVELRKAYNLIFAIISSLKSLFSTALKTNWDFRTALKHKIPKSNKSVDR